MASTSKFTFLETTHLASQPPSSEVTMQNLIDTSERMAEEAKEIMPYSFDECTYAKGYLRQAIWSCLDCGEKGVCYGCSISCHSDHRLIELWTKRSFRCDCPTTLMPPTSNGKRRRCALNPPGTQPGPSNEENHYNQNFAGRFCRCGKVYDPETEDEAMLNCMACEDWYHESCLNLRPRAVAKADPDKEEEDEDEEEAVLIPSDTYDGLICAECAGGHPLIRHKAGTEGWMMIEASEEGGSSTVIRRRVQVKEEKEEKPEGESYGLKRSAEDEEVVRGPKKPRLEHGDIKTETDHTMTSVQNGVANGGEGQWKGEGDVFLAYGIRDQLKASLDAATIAKLPFPLADAEIYEPPKDDHQEETLDEVTNRVVGPLPRVQAIEALRGYQTMKSASSPFASLNELMVDYRDKLKTMLTGHAQAGQTVRKEDIETFFAELKEQKAH